MIAVMIDRKLGPWVAGFALCGFLFSLVKTLRMYYVSVLRVAGAGVEKYAEEILNGRKHDTAIIEASLSAGVELFKQYDKSPTHTKTKETKSSVVINHEKNHTHTNTSAEKKENSMVWQIHNYDYYSNLYEDQEDCIKKLILIKGKDMTILEKVINRDLPQKNYNLLHHAICKSWEDVVDFIVNQDISCYVSNREKNSIFLSAVENENSKILAMLIFSGKF